MIHLIFMILFSQVANLLASDPVNNAGYLNKVTDYSGFQNNTSGLAGILEPKKWSPKISGGKVNVENTKSPSPTKIHFSNLNLKDQNENISFKKILQKRDIKIPQPPGESPKLPTNLPTLPNIPSADLPEIPKVDLPEIPKVDLPEITKAGLPEIPKVDLPDISKLPNVKLHDISKLSDADLPQLIKTSKNYVTKIPGSTDKKLPDYNYKTKIPFERIGRHLTKRQLLQLPVELPKLPELPRIPEVELQLPYIPNIPSLEMPKLPNLPSISFLNRKELYPDYGHSESSSSLSSSSPLTNPLPKQARKQEPIKKSDYRIRRNCDEKRVTYKEKTRITIHEKESENSSPKYSDESILSQIIPNSLNPNQLIRTSSSKSDSWNEARRYQSKSRHDEWNEDIVYEDVTEIIMNESDDSSETRQADNQDYDSFESVLSFYQYFEPLKYDEKYKVNREKREAEEIEEDTTCDTNCENSENERNKATKVSHTKPMAKNLIVNEDKSAINGVYEGGPTSITGVISNKSGEGKTIIDAKTLIIDNPEENHSLSKIKATKLKKNKIKSITKLTDKDYANESKSNFQKSLSSPKISKEIVEEEAEKRLQENDNLLLQKLEINKYESHLKKSQKITDIKLELMKIFFNVLKLKLESSNFDIDLKFNDEILTDETPTKEIKNGRNKRSTEEFNEIFLSQMIHVDPLINKRVLTSSETKDNYIDRDKRLAAAAAAEGNAELQEEEEEEEKIGVNDRNAEGSTDDVKPKTKKEVKEVDNNNSPDETTNKETISSTSSSTPSSTSEFEPEETTEYEYDLDEDACPSDIIGVLTTKVRCAFNVITSKIVGIEFGPNCC